MSRFSMFGAGAIASAAILTAAVFAQGGQEPTAEPTPVTPGVMRMESSLGSFMLQGEGRIEMEFRGTVLLNDFEGAPPVFEGNVRKEYEGHGRTVWFGSGKAIIEGKWRHLQWFGGDLKATWNGIGMARLFGEYDPQSGKAGTVVVDDEPELPWMSVGTTTYVPKEFHPAWKEILKQRERERSGEAAPPTQPGEAGAQPAQPETPGHEGHGH